MNAMDMVAACMRFQTLPPAVVDLGSIPPETLPPRGRTLAPTDLGIADHATEGMATDDVHDDGTPLPVAALTYGEAG